VTHSLANSAFLKLEVMLNSLITTNNFGVKTILTKYGCLFIT